MLEADWQRQVIDLAHTFRWRVAHFRPAKTSHGWVTPVAADGAGFPDLLLTRDRILAVELKSETGKLSEDQAVWLDAFRLAGVETFVWRPSDAAEVLAVLRRRVVA